MPSDLLVNEGRQGIQRKDQMRLNTVAQCAKYGETALKLLSTLRPPNVSSGDINDLVTIMTAQLKYLQEEHNMMLVNGSFGEGVEKLYRNFRRHTSQFTPDALDALQAAVNLNNHNYNSENRGRGRGRGNGFRGGYNPRGRGSYFNPSGNQYRVPYGRGQDHGPGGPGQHGQDHQ